MTEFAHLFPVEACQVLVREPRVPLTAEGLHAREFSGDGDVLELWLQPQVKGSRSGLADLLAIEQTVCLSVDALQVQSCDRSLGHRRRPRHHLLRQLSGGEPEGIDVFECDQRPLTAEGYVPALPSSGIEDDDALGLVGVVRRN